MSCLQHLQEDLSQHSYKEDDYLLPAITHAEELLDRRREGSRRMTNNGSVEQAEDQGGTNTRVSPERPPVCTARRPRVVRAGRCDESARPTGVHADARHIGPSPGGRSLPDAADVSCDQAPRMSARFS